MLMKNHLTALGLILCFSSSIYSQTEENPWLFGIGFSNVNPESSENTSYKLPSFTIKIRDN